MNSLEFYQLTNMTIPEFSRLHNIDISTVRNQIKRGLCRWPRPEHKDSSKHSLYSTWTSMKTRCYNKAASNYKNYGERGITISLEWRLDFWKFVEDMGPRPIGYTLERINNDKGYSKENCRWASLSEQATNSRKRKDNTSTERGINKCPMTNTWVVRVQKNNQRHFIGRFKTFKEAQDAKQNYIH